MMGKICAVKQCSSGSRTDKIYRTKHKYRQASLFKVPKCPDRRKLWSNNLDFNLSETQFICERHFSDKDLQKVDSTILHNGIIDTLPRIRWRLKPNALPNKMNECNKFVKEIEDHCYFANSEANIAPITIVLDEEEQPMESRDTQAEILQLSIKDNKMQAASLQPSIKVNEMQAESLRPSIEVNETQAETLQPSIEANKTQVEILQPFFKVNETQVKILQPSFEVSETQAEILQPSIEASETQAKILQPSIKTGTNDRLSVPLKKLEISTKTFDTLKAHLKKGLLRERWCWRPNGNKLMFTLSASHNSEARIHVEIAEDLSATIVTVTGHRIELDRVTSLMDMQSTFKAMEKVPVCSGTGMAIERRAPLCLGVLVDMEKYNSHRCAERCFRCRKLRQKLKKNANRENRADKKSIVDSNRKDTRKKFKRLKTKTQDLLLDIEILKKKCSSIKKSTLEEAISALPEFQKEAVRDCFEAAKRVNKKGRRYTLEWIYECVLMYTRSSRLYESIRSREILPLPCVDTLKKYFEKIPPSTNGSQDEIFECQPAKEPELDESDKRGALLIDDVKLNEFIS